MRSFESLTEREILALAISLEEEDERVYADFAEGLRQDFAGTAAIFDGMREEESGHRRRLTDLYREKFGDHIPLIRRQDVRGFVNRKPIWLARPLGLDERAQAGQRDGSGNAPILRKSRCAITGCGRPAVARRPRAGRTLAPDARRGT